MQAKNRAYKKLKNTLLVIGMTVIVVAGYVAVVNIKSENMTVRQKILRAVYPLVMGGRKLFGKGDKELSNAKNVLPGQPFYDLSFVLNNGDTFSMSTLKGKSVLLVNTASDCGYTAQYEDLQKLYVDYKDKLMVIGFPANDFKEQEKGSDEEIARFCKLNYGVSFPLARKSIVVKKDGQNKIFQWLTDKNKNGWNNKPPSWNFSKYIINKEGVLTHYFDPSVSPVSNEVIHAINN